MFLRRVRFLRLGARIEAQTLHLGIHSMPKVRIVVHFATFNVKMPIGKSGKILQVDVVAFRVFPARGKWWIRPEMPTYKGGMGLI